MNNKQWYAALVVGRRIYVQYTDNKQQAQSLVRVLRRLGDKNICSYADFDKPQGENVVQVDDIIKQAA